MFVNIFNLFLIFITTFATYKFFTLKENIETTTLIYQNYIKNISSVIDRAESYNEPHAYKVTELSVKIAKAMDLSEADIGKLTLASYLHDIGMLLIPNSFTKKNSVLNQEECVLMRTHPLIAELKLRKGAEENDEIPVIIRWHHEWWDGSGYPDGLCGDEIPLLSRILAISDAISAMKEDRPYRVALSDSKLKFEVQKMSGIQFDPEIASLWLKLEENNLQGKS